MLETFILFTRTNKLAILMPSYQTNENSAGEKRKWEVGGSGSSTVCLLPKSPHSSGSRRKE